MKKSIRFIINPISGVSDKRNIPSLIEQYLDSTLFDYDIAFTERKKHATEIALQSIEEKIDIVCAVGGDGSVHEVGTALIGSSTKLAIIPIGSGNGLARHLNIPLNVEDAIKCINQQNAIKMDTVKVNDRRFLGVGGFGLDAIVADSFDKGTKRGFWGYVQTVFREFFKYNPLNVSIDVDGQVKSLPVVLCTVANSSQFGNGFTVSPESDVTDGELELCILKPFSLWNIPSLVLDFFRKRSHKSRFSEIISFKKAKLQLSGAVAHYDGEPMPVKSEVEVSVVPKSLNVLVGE